MKSQNIKYEQPQTEVVEVVMESSVLSVSVPDYQRGDDWTWN